MAPSNHYYPYQPCMVYLPTFTITINQGGFAPVENGVKSPLQNAPAENCTPWN